LCCKTYVVRQQRKPVSVIVDDRVFICPHLVFLHALVSGQVDESVETGFDVAQIKPAFLPRKFIEVPIISIVCGKHKKAARLQHPINLGQTIKAIFVSHVVNRIERKQNEIESGIGETAQISGVATEEVRVRISLAGRVNAIRRIVDARIVRADFEQESGGSAAPDADVKQLLTFDYWRDRLQNHGLGLEYEIKVLVPGHGFRARIAAWLVASTTSL